MASLRSTATAARHALWLGGVLVALAGLFGMHGLDTHGAAGADAMSHPAMTSSPANTLGAADQALSDTVHEASATVAGAAVTFGPSAMDKGMVGMCMAVLSLALLALLLLLRRMPNSPSLWVLARPVRAPSYRGRDPDPPSLFALSTQRC
ncbi:MAG: hypothetical protein H0V07_09755 [Propionibacteriales bacterium]|nr:hypothetical protein [Propionibacteriales bacterium]